MESERVHGVDRSANSRVRAHWSARRGTRDSDSECTAECAVRVSPTKAFGPRLARALHRYQQRDLIPHPSATAFGIWRARFDDGFRRGDGNRRARLFTGAGEDAAGATAWFVLGFLFGAGASAARGHHRLESEDYFLSRFM